MFTFEPNSVVILCSEAKCVAGCKTHTQAVVKQGLCACKVQANPTYNPNIQHSLSTKEMEYLL